MIEISKLQLIMISTGGFLLPFKLWKKKMLWETKIDKPYFWHQLIPSLIDIYIFMYKYNYSLRVKFEINPKFFIRDTIKKIIE